MFVEEIRQPGAMEKPRNIGGFLSFNLVYSPFSWGSEKGDQAKKKNQSQMSKKKKNKKIITKKRGSLCRFVHSLFIDVKGHKKKISLFCNFGRRRFFLCYFPRSESGVLGTECVSERGRGRGKLCTADNGRGRERDRREKMIWYTDLVQASGDDEQREKKNSWQMKWKWTWK